MTDRYTKKLNTTEQPAGEATDLLTQAVETQAELDPSTESKPSAESPKEPPEKQTSRTQPNAKELLSE